MKYTAAGLTIGLIIGRTARALRISAVQWRCCVEALLFYSNDRHFHTTVVSPCQSFIPYVFVGGFSPTSQLSQSKSSPFQSSPCGVYVGQSTNTGTDYSASLSVNLVSPSFHRCSVPILFIYRRLCITVVIDRVVI